MDSARWCQNKAITYEHTSSKNPTYLIQFYKIHFNIDHSTGSSPHNSKHDLKFIVSEKVASSRMLLETLKDIPSGNLTYTIIKMWNST